MSGISAHLLDGLVSHSEGSFYDALRQISKGEDYRGVAGAEIAITVALEMSRRADVPERLQAQRLGALLSKLNLNVTGKDALAIQARSLPASLSNEVASCLSPTQLKRLHSREESLPKRDFTHEPPIPGRAQPSDAVIPAVTNESEPVGAYSTVLLLSKIPNQDGNKRLLKGAHFGTTQLDSKEALREELKTSIDICAILVDGSFLRGMNRDEQTAFFDALAIYSTFVWIRIDGSELKINHLAVRESLKGARCRREQVAAHEVSIQPDGILREAELEEIQRACCVLRTRDGARFVPGEITEDEGLVLLAAAQKHAQELEYTGDLKIISLEAKFLHGGFSGAKIALVRVNQDGKYVVAKIDQKGLLIQEMRRFQRFIQKWGDKLRPKLFLHGSAAVILFSLVPDENDSAKPAPMLEDCLKSLWTAEIFGQSDERALDLKVSNLKTGLKNIARSLCQLNNQDPHPSEFKCWSNPSMACFRQLEQRHVTWIFCDQAIRAWDLSERQFSMLAERGVVHGDLHLRNILVRGDQEMHLIDYAGSGPGHPAIDLVRLELALYLCCFKQLEEESRYEEFQRKLSLENVDVAALEGWCGESHLPAVNRVCIGGCVTARDQALEAVKAHGGGHKDYLAAKYLVAWQSLLMEGRQTSLTRSIICALAPEIASW